jgi:hypothetical protein
MKGKGGGYNTNFNFFFVFLFFFCREKKKKKVGLLSKVFTNNAIINLKVAKRGHYQTRIQKVLVNK